jgi:SAM-dependent methyltransferase
MAARDVAAQLGVKANYVVADCRHLPFTDHSFDIVFSYSVLQHLSRADVYQTVKDMARVLKPTGQSLVQMPNSSGLRNLFLQAQQRFQDPDGFGVRYWSKVELSKLLGEFIGPTELSVDGFFSLNPQMSDIDLLPRKYRYVVRVSEALRKLSETFPILLNAADSLYVSSTARTTS